MKRLENKLLEGMFYGLILGFIIGVIVFRHTDITSKAPITHNAIKITNNDTLYILER